LLYNSPAGLVFYWTLNNVFSLVKNLVYKIPVTWKKESKAEKAIISKPNSKVFLLGSMFITVLIGLLIPSTIIAASPQEFVDITYFHNPLWYLVSSLCLAAGTFLIWMRIFYWLASDAGKAIFDKVVWILCAVMLVNYMFFGTDLGILSSNLQYENGLSFSQAEQIVNVLVIAVLAVIMYMIYCKWSRVASTVLLTAVIAVGGMSAYNVYNIYGPVMDAKVQAEALADEMPHFTLSTEGKNVIEIVNEQPIFNDGWIPCSERLPQHGSNILVCQRDGYVNVGYYSRNKFKDMNSFPYEDAIAWRELPQPYQPKGE